MANDYALEHYPAYAPPRDLWAPLAFLALLLLIFVGLDAFSPPALVSQFGGVKEASRGDTLRQPAFFSGDNLATFDCVIANPPFSLEKWGEEAWAGDPYGRPRPVITHGCST